jgi:hypothetical protein
MRNEKLSIGNVWTEGSSVPGGPPPVINSNPKDSANRTMEKRELCGLLITAGKPKNLKGLPAQIKTLKMCYFSTMSALPLRPDDQCGFFFFPSSKNMLHNLRFLGTGERQKNSTLCGPSQPSTLL